MSDKDFKVKNKLIVNGLNNASGVILSTNNTLDSHSLLPTQYGGTGTTTTNETFDTKQGTADTRGVGTKKTTITCVKGKAVKKVTSVKPVCPKGNKKK